MANRETSIGPRERQYNEQGQFLGIGIADHGTKTRQEMIEAYRRYHAYELSLHKRALEIPDEDLVAKIYEGNKFIREAE